MELTIEQAKGFLKSKGYYVGNLWHIDDVFTRFDCTEEEAQEILNEALTSDSTFNTIWENIDYYGDTAALKPFENGSSS